MNVSTKLEPKPQLIAATHVVGESPFCAMAGGNNSLKETIRRCVHEELTGTCTNSVINRTRELIHSSGSFSSRQLLQTSSADGATSTLQRRTSSPGHPWCFGLKRKRPAASGQAKMKRQITQKLCTCSMRGQMKMTRSKVRNRRLGRRREPDERDLDEHAVGSPHKPT